MGNLTSGNRIQDKVSAEIKILSSSCLILMWNVAFNTEMTNTLRIRLYEIHLTHEEMKFIENGEDYKSSSFHVHYITLMSVIMYKRLWRTRHMTCICMKRSVYRVWYVDRKGSDLYESQVKDGKISNGTWRKCVVRSRIGGIQLRAW